MAEALFTFLIMLAMLLILWRSRTWWLTALIAGLIVGYAVIVPAKGCPSWYSSRPSCCGADGGPGAAGSSRR